MSSCGCGAEQADSLERKTLIILLSINAFMFVAELTLGWVAQSTGLIADSLDMLADATVYEEETGYMTSSCRRHRWNMSRSDSNDCFGNFGTASAENKCYVVAKTVGVPERKRRKACLFAIAVLPLSRVLSSLWCSL